jgi:hypothetical protein
MKLAQDWLTRLEANYQFRRVGLFRILEPAQMPPLVVDGCTLDEKAMGSLLVALKHNTNIVTDELKQYVSAERLQPFAHTLFDRWQADEANPNDRWLLFSAARLGGESIVPRIVAFSRQMRTKRVPLEPRLSLEGLVMNGTQPALLYVYEFCMTVGKTRLHNLARKLLTAHAEAQNLTFFQLGDRVVPDREFNGQIFDYGQRQFTGFINGDLTPMLRDGQGKIRADLPKPGKRDQSGFAQEDWRTARNFIASVKTTQSILLERAMIDERRWSINEFDPFFRCHRVMRYFAQTLIWGAYEQNRLVGCFYITPDLTLSDIHYQTFHIPPGAQIGIVHPILLTEDERQTWNHILHDFEIIQIFPQLNRDTYSLTAEERESGEITRFRGLALFQSQLTRGKKGIGRADWKSLRSSEREALGRFFPQSNSWAIIAFKSAYRVDGFWFESDNHKLPLNRVSRVIISEVLRDLKKVRYP